MSSKAVARIPDPLKPLTTGHGDFPPRAPRSEANGGGMPTIYVNDTKGGGVVAYGAGGAGPGSTWENHPGKPPHTPGQYDRTNSIPGFDSSDVDWPIARVGDQIEQDAISGGSSDVFAGVNVFVGNNNSPEPTTPSSIAMTNGDDFDADNTGTGKTYVAQQISLGNVSASEIAKASSVVATAADTTPSKSPGPLSKDCADIASITPFPTGDAIDDIVLSPNYTVRKLTRKPSIQYDHPVRGPSQGLSVEELICNLKLLAVNCIEPIRAKYPNLFVTNTWRPMGDNLKSQHPLGMAADIQFRGIPNSEYYVIAQWVKDNVSYDQFLLEYKTTGTGLPWLHISFNKDNLRKQVLTLMNGSTYGQGLIQLA